MIVVFGSFNIDFVMRLERMPAPGETILGADYILVPGGKGANQACAAARATATADDGGTRVAMIGKVGQDDWGGFATTYLQEAGVNLDGVARCETPTGCAAIFVDGRGENTIAVASGANLDATADQVPDALLGPDCWLILQMEVEPEENWRLISRARRRGAKVLLNVAPAAPVPAAALDQVDILVVNEIEAAMVAREAGIAEDDPTALARRLSAAHGFTCITTLGAAGAIAVAPDAAWRIDPLPVSPVDTTGAGDAFIGILAAALERGVPLPDALRRGSVGAGLCCTEWGTQTSFPWAERIEERLAELAPARPLA